MTEAIPINYTDLNNDLSSVINEFIIPGINLESAEIKFKEKGGNINEGMNPKYEVSINNKKFILYSFEKDRINRAKNVILANGVINTINELEGSQVIYTPTYYRTKNNSLVADKEGTKFMLKEFVEGKTIKELLNEFYEKQEIKEPLVSLKIDTLKNLKNGCSQYYNKKLWDSRVLEQDFIKYLSLEKNLLNELGDLVKTTHELFDKHYEAIRKKIDIYNQYSNYTNKLSNLVFKETIEKESGKKKINFIDLKPDNIIKTSDGKLCIIDTDSTIVDDYDCDYHVLFNFFTKQNTGLNNSTFLNQLNLNVIEPLSQELINETNTEANNILRIRNFLCHEDLFDLSNFIYNYTKPEMNQLPDNLKVESYDLIMEGNGLIIQTEQDRYFYDFNKDFLIKQEHLMSILSKIKQS